MGDDPDRIDQMMWAEIPVESNSKETEEFLKKYRKSDDHRSQRWKDLDRHENEDKKVIVICFYIIET